MLDLTGKVALVTGGAGGLGRATAAELAKAGAVVALWDVDAARIQEAVDEIRAAGGNARGWAVDVTDPAAVRAAAAVVEAELGPVYLLDNNAGVHAWGDFLDASEADARRQIDVNFASFVWTTRAFLPGMVARGEGRLLYIASAAGLFGVPGMAVYSATKHAVVGLAESLRQELSRAGADGIKVTIACPSFIATGMFDGASPPWATPWLDPRALASKIVRATREGRTYVREPFMVKLAPVVNALPGPIADALLALTGMRRSLVGARPPKC